MFVSQQMKRNIIITNKNIKYELTDELPKDIRHKKNLKTPWSYRLVSNLLPKMKILSILQRYQKLDIELFPKSSTLYAVLGFSQVFYQWL